jgi:hypothetical protein
VACRPATERLPALAASFAVLYCCCYQAMARWSVVHGMLYASKCTLSSMRKLLKRRYK